MSIDRLRKEAEKRRNNFVIGRNTIEKELALLENRKSKWSPEIINELNPPSLNPKEAFSSLYKEPFQYEEYIKELGKMNEFFSRMAKLREKLISIALEELNDADHK